MMYLRKTPQDYIIEELMLKHRCTKEKAEQIYNREIERNKSPSRNEHSPQRQQEPGLANFFTNMLGVPSPNKQPRSTSR